MRAANADQSFVAALAQVRAVPAGTPKERVLARYPDAHAWSIMGDAIGISSGLAGRCIGMTLNGTEDDAWLDADAALANTPKESAAERASPSMAPGVTLQATPAPVPLADPPGEWTREPVKETAYYWVRKKGHLDIWVLDRSFIPSTFDLERWSQPIPEPPQ